jgi:uncharacterized OB-fold protein
MQRLRAVDLEKVEITWNGKVRTFTTGRFVPVDPIEEKESEECSSPSLGPI